MRVRSLTKATRYAFVQTLEGLLALSHYLLRDQACQYVLFGIFQTDPVENEFSIYRQLSGGNYFVSLEQVLSSAHLRRLKLFEKLNLEDTSTVSVSAKSCCTSEFSEVELELLDRAIENSEDISQSERSALFYICGYTFQ